LDKTEMWLKWTRLVSAFTLWSVKLICITYKDSVRTSQKNSLISLDRTVGECCVDK
jgi:hypothetical protein